MVECTGGQLFRNLESRERNKLLGSDEGCVGLASRNRNPDCPGGCIDGRETATSFNIYLLVGVPDRKVVGLVEVGA